MKAETVEALKAVYIDAQELNERADSTIFISRRGIDKTLRYLRSTPTQYPRKSQLKPGALDESYES